MKEDTNSWGFLWTTGDIKPPLQGSVQGTTFPTHKIILQISNSTSQYKNKEWITQWRSRTLPRVPMSNGRQIPQNTNVSYKSHKIGPDLDSCQERTKVRSYIHILILIHT